TSDQYKINEFQIEKVIEEGVAKAINISIPIDKIGNSLLKKKINFETTQLPASVPLQPNAIQVVIPEQQHHGRGAVPVAVNQNNQINPVKPPEPMNVNINVNPPRQRKKKEPEQNEIIDKVEKMARTL